MFNFPLISLYLLALSVIRVALIGASRAGTKLGGGESQIFTTGTRTVRKRRPRARTCTTVKQSAT